MNFEELRDKFIQILETCSKIENCDLAKTPFSLLTNYADIIGQFENTLTQIKEFTANRTNPTEQRIQLISQVNSQFDNLIEHSTPVLLVDLLKGSDLSLEKAKIQSLIDEISST